MGRRVHKPRQKGKEKGFHCRPSNIHSEFSHTQAANYLSRFLIKRRKESLPEELPCLLCANNEPGFPKSAKRRCQFSSQCPFERSHFPLSKMPLLPRGC